MTLPYRALRIYSMARARDSIGAARVVWVAYARGDNRNLVREKRAGRAA